MKTVRAFYRLIGVSLLILLLVIVFCFLIPFCFGNQLRRTRLKNKLIYSWAIAVSALIGLKVEVKGPLPEPPFLLVSNHLGYVDILPFWSYLPTTFIAKDEISSWPAIGWISKLLGILFIDRTNKRDINRVNELIEANINKAQGVILFPEGTSSKGKKVLPFKSSLLYYPALKNMPVYSASIAYAVPSDNHQAWNEVCWWGDMDFTPHFWNLLKIRKISAKVTFGKQPVQDEDRKSLAKNLQAQVDKNFEPTFRES